VHLPPSTKAATWSAIAGVIVGMALMPYAFGYISAGDAEKIAKTRTENALVAVLTPECAAKFRALPDYAAKRDALEKAPSYQHSGMFPKELVSLPGQSYTNSDLVAACAAVVLKMKAAAN
jgi:hypothetical protein